MFIMAKNRFLSVCCNFAHFNSWKMEQLQHNQEQPTDWFDHMFGSLPPSDDKHFLQVDRCSVTAQGFPWHHPKASITQALHCIYTHMFLFQWVMQFCFKQLQFDELSVLIWLILIHNCAANVSPNSDSTPEGYTVKEVQQSQAFFVLTGLKKTLKPQSEQKFINFLC